MRVFLLRMVAAKNSRKRRAAWSPASAITTGRQDDLPLRNALASHTAEFVVDRARIMLPPRATALRLPNAIPVGT